MTVGTHDIIVKFPSDRATGLTEATLQPCASAAVARARSPLAAAAKEEREEAAKAAADKAEAEATTEAEEAAVRLCVLWAH